MGSPSRVHRHGRPGSPDHRVEFLPGRARSALLTVLGLGMAVVCVLFLASGEAGVSPFQWAALLAGVPLGLWVALFSGRRLFTLRPLLVLDRDGLHDDASVLAVGFVPWSDIVGCSLLAMGRQRMLGVAVVDPDALLARLNPVRRLLVRSNLRKGGTPVLIQESVLPVSLEELYADIEGFHVSS